MALSAAERQRRYRANRDADPEKRNKYLKNRKTKYKNDMKSGTRKNVNEMTPREHRKVRKQWRVNKRSMIKRKKQLEKQLPVTPPSSPEPQAMSEIQEQLPKQATHYRKTKKSKLQKKIQLLENLLKKERKKSDMYRKRIIRKSEHGGETPRSKTKNLLKHLIPKHRTNTGNKALRKTLIFHYALIDQMKNNYKTSKKTVARMVAGNIMKKYKFKYSVRKELGMYTGTRLRKRTGCISSREWKSVRLFYERDDVSQIVAGKKCTRTKKKMKRQKRLMKDSLGNLHKKYIAEHNSSISYTTFYRLKPFWIVVPSEKDRETCLCKICENFRLAVEALQQQQVISPGTNEQLIKKVTCNDRDKGCMYSTCEHCKHTLFEIEPAKQYDQVTWKYWSTGQKKYTQDGKEKTVTFPVQETKTGTVSTLLDSLNQQLPRYKQHTFNITNQYDHYKRLRNTMKGNEVLVHIDFSQNYNSKLPKEIQSMHYGAAKSQITLHTGIYYIGNQDGHSFTSVSDSLNHSPSGIWAHLTPLLKDIKKENPNVNVIHFFSDGPVTQYKQKGNFYLFASEIYKHGFTLGTWNFHECGHGKGVPDGIGGAVKRSADTAVSFGNGIMNATDFISAIRPKTKVELYFISEESITPYEAKLKRKLPSVPGTMRSHQIISTSEYNINYRDISCTCTVGNCCPSHVLKSFSFERPADMELNVEIPETVNAEIHVPETVGEVNVQIPETVGEVNVQIPETVSEVNVQIPETVGEVNVQIPETVGEVNAQIPETVGEVNVQIPETVGEVNVQTPETVGEVNVQIPETVDEVTVQIPETVHEVNIETQETVSMEIDVCPDICESGLPLLGKYVAVMYNGRIYPGIVNDASDQDVFVACMHQIGNSKKNNNCYYWPQKIKDECWYEMQNVVCIIPPPLPSDQQNNFKVDEHTWRKVFAKV